MRTVAFCECNRFCRSVLAHHWPDVPIYSDVRKLSAARLVGDGIRADVICGGFPCQDLSIAGRGAGLSGERSGLFFEFARIVREVRPAYAIVENVTGLLGRGLGNVLGELAAIGYDAEWHCIPACAVGADHERDRVWIISYPQHVAHADKPRLERWLRAELRECSRQLSLRSRGSSDARAESIAGTWFTQPAVRRVADGIPARVDRLRALGNAVVPQIPQIIGRAIMRAEGITSSS